MRGLKVGHVSHADKGTGISVFLFDEPAVGSYQLCGSGPASHELATLEAETSVPFLHGLVLTGGSAFGLYAAKGVMRFLAERHIGLPLPHGVVPIVPVAGIYDLGYKRALPPTEEDAYQACLSAREDNVETGRLGAGTGATIGKIIPDANRMTGGLGRAQLALPNGIEVTAYAVVNAVGDVRDAQGQIIAGAKRADGQFADCAQFVLSGQGETVFFKPSNTTLVAVFTNAQLSKPELKRVSKMAVAGMARAISPVFTCYDGDIIFSISIGHEKASVFTIGTLAAEAVRLAIVNAVKDAILI